MKREEAEAAMAAIAPDRGMDIGSGVKVYPVHDKDGAFVGIIEEHIGKDGAPCSGYCHFRHAANPDTVSSWVVESFEPLTLSPSVLCRTCGHHGFIRQGKWIEA